ncbi:hypothetical protein PS3A_18730 [Pseudomonas sp. 3A(2025)]
MLLATDASNSVLAELKSGSANRLAYTPYGVQSAQRPVDATLGFNGQRRETPTGWYHLGNGHRVYNPVLRRFHTPDTLSPFGKGGLNAYAYCQGDPVNFSDPSGRFIHMLPAAFSLFKTAARHTRKLVQAFFSSRPPTLTTRFYQAAYLTMGTGVVMHTAGFASGAVVIKAGAAVLTAVDTTRKAYKTFKTLRDSRLGIAISRRLAPLNVQLNDVEVIPRTSPYLSAQSIRTD